MKRFTLLLTILSLFMQVESFAQTTSSISGQVVDAVTLEPMIGVSVLVDGTNKGEATDVDGKFTIKSLTKGSTITLKMSFTGYKESTVDFKLTKTANTLTEPVMLRVERMVLDEIEVLGTAPIAKQLGDTTQFNAGAFKTNPDATAEDLLAKMPGFTVSNGTVEAEGESISQIYVDGKAFFKDDPSSALNALTADMVESVQVFDEQSDKSRFTGVYDGDTKKTLNIVTKAKKNSVRMGDIIIGYGTDNRYSSKGNLSIFEGDHRFTVGYGVNNINQAALSGGRYYGRDGISGLQESAGIKLNYSGDFKRDEDHFTALGVNYVFQRTKNNKTTSSEQEGLLFSEVTSSETMNNTLSVTNSFKLDLETTQGSNKIYFRPSASFSNSASNYADSSVRQTDGVITNTSDNTKHTDTGTGYNIGGSLMWLHRLSTKSSISAGAEASLSKSNSDTYLVGSIGSLSLTDEQLVDSLYNQATNVYTGANSVEGSVSYTYAIDEKQGITAEYELGYEWSDSDSKTYLYNEFTGQYDDIYDSLSNVFERDYVTQNAGFGYSLNVAKKINFSLSASYQHSALHNDLVYPENENYSYNFSSFKTNMRLKWNISDSKNLMLHYGGRPLLPSVSQLQDVVNNTDPLNVSVGNPYLDQGYNNMFMISYSSSNMQKSSYFRAFIRGDNQVNGFASNVTNITQDTTVNGVPIVSGAQLTRTENISGTMNFMGGFNHSFPISSIQSQFNWGIFNRYSRQPSKYDGVAYYSNSNSTSLNLMLNSNISRNIDFSVSNNLSYTLSGSSNESVTMSNYINEKANFKFNWIFLKSFVFNTDYTYNYTYYSSNAPTTTPDFHLLNLGLGYKFLGNNAEIRVSAYDLLNQSQSLSQSVSSYYITNSVSNVMQRYFMLTFSFKFNNMKSPVNIQQTEERQGPGGMMGDRPSGPPSGGGGRMF